MPINRRITISPRDADEGDFAFGYYSKIKPGPNEIERERSRMDALLSGANPGTRKGKKLVGSPSKVGVQGYFQSATIGERYGHFRHTIEFQYTGYKSFTDALLDALHQVVQANSDILVLTHILFSQR